MSDELTDIVDPKLLDETMSVSSLSINLFGKKKSGLTGIQIQKFEQEYGSGHVWTKFCFKLDDKQVQEFLLDSPTMIEMYLVKRVFRKAFLKEKLIYVTDHSDHDHPHFEIGLSFHE